jgi:asparagine synthase (glutamine-hydrolysing)
MYHRGPNHTGYFTDEYVALAHNRLSILDLSEKAHQPMLSDCNRYVIIYNGEVFNFRELAKKYTLNLKSRSDTEVILKLFIINGMDFVQELNGMFAFAIYDREKMELFLYRDRLGIKPLYYTQNQDSFIFGSELKAIVALPEVSRTLEINHDAVSRYFHLGYIPSPITIYQNVYKLEPGSMLKVSLDNVQQRKWWGIDKHKLTEWTINDEQQAIHDLDELLTDAVKLRLISDVPIGTLLSGGVDSSLVSAIAAKHTTETLNTFCIRFEYGKYNESEWAKRIARHIGANHHELTVSAREAMDYLPLMIKHYDEPFGDTSAIPTMLVSKMASESVTVTLSGDGGDELFHGYGAHLWAERMSKPYINSFKGVIGTVLNLGDSRMQRASWMFQPNPNMQAHIFSQEQYLFSDSELDNLLNFELSAPWTPRIPPSLRKLSSAEIQAIYDMQYYLPDDLLTKVDRASMLFSLENRVPLLDYRVVEWSLNLNPKLKIKEERGKYLLRQLLSKYVPTNLFDRPKQGFAVPLKEWMRDDLKQTFLEYLNPDILTKYGFVNVETVEKLKTRFYDKKVDYLYNRLWLVAAFHMWLEQSVFNKK